MPSNIEIKARVRDREALLRKIEAISEAPGELLRQEDTFFGAPSGRLKLRVLAPNLSLIHI